MSTVPTVGWTPAEEDAVRAVLLDGQDAMTVGPAPWGALERRRRAARRRRRLRGVVAVAAVLSVAGLVGGTLLPGRGGASLAPASTDAVPPTDTGVTVGSLAGDTQFLDALRAWLVSGSQPDVPAGTRAGDVRFLLATEVPGARVVLAHWPGGPTWTWVTGPQGGRMQDMSTGNSCEVVGEVCWIRYGRGWTSWVDQKPDGTAVPVGRPGDGVIVATVTGSDVVVSAGNDVTADGTLRRLTVTAQERWPGAFVAPLTIPPARIDVVVTPPGGRPVKTWDGSGSGIDPDAWWGAATHPAGAPATRGTPVPALADAGADVRGDLVMAGVRAAGTGTGDGTRSRVVWSAGDSGAARAVIAYGTASGGWVRVGVERVVSGGGFTLDVYAPAPVAADGLDTAGVAWRSGTGTAVVVGPAAARAFRWVGAQGPTGDAVPLDAGGASTDRPVPDGATAVQFEAADGTVLGRAQVASAWPDGTVLS